jgi:acyl carrier protein
MITEEQIRAALAKVCWNLDADALPADANFGDSGLDSLDQATLLLTLQEQYGLVVPENKESSVNSIQAILSFAAQAAA